MKIKIKLRDITNEQWDDYKHNACPKLVCPNACPCYGSNCSFSKSSESWINKKDLYSDKFLNQEIEIPDILDEEEKEYLANVIKPFKDRVICITKTKIKSDKYFISITIHSDLSLTEKELITLPYFQNDIYKEMEIDKDYTLKELGL